MSVDDSSLPLLPDVGLDGEPAAEGDVGLDGVAGLDGVVVEVGGGVLGDIDLVRVDTYASILAAVPATAPSAAYCGVRSL